MELAPLQKPHPPVWYGVHAPESAARAARKGLQVVSLDPVPATRAVVRQLSAAAWREAWGATPLPLMGLGRFIVVADTDAAGARASRGAPIRDGTTSFTLPAPPARPARPRIRGRRASTASRRWDRGSRARRATVAAFLREQLDATGSNYCVGQFAFGDLTLAETLALDRAVRAPGHAGTAATQPVAAV